MEPSTMDYAQEVELKALSRQDKMNSVIDRGDSPIQQFYSGASVFLTGASGFIGKQFVEKIFRACDLKIMYVLLRAKKGKSIQERLNTILQDPVFELLRKKKPNFADNIVAVEGDVSDIAVGLSERDWTTVTHEVDTIVHMAATVRFDEPIRKATIINVRGTREMIRLARECKTMRSFVHVSTAYCHSTPDRIDTEVLEQFYPSPAPPEAMIDLVEEMEESRLDAITANLIKGWQNTYTFTKALAEELVRKADDLPICVVRPPIVTPSYYEPNPGWLDHNVLQGPSGFFSELVKEGLKAKRTHHKITLLKCVHVNKTILLIGLGIIHVYLYDLTKYYTAIPLDYVNNAIIAAGWDAAEKKKQGEVKIPIYTVCNVDDCMTFKQYREYMARNAHRLISPVTLWYCFVIDVSEKWKYFILTWLLHYIPAYIVDFVMYVLGKKIEVVPSLVDLYRKIDKMSAVYEYFVKNNWFFRDHNIKSMVSRMSSEDAAIFNCDLSTIDFEEYVNVWFVGIRKYIVKDGLQGTQRAYEKQSTLRILNYIVFIVLFYVLWKILYSTFSVVTRMC